MILENHLDVPADPDAVFALINDVERVAGCLPGATLDGQEGDAYHGRVKFKVGPISAAYSGTGSARSPPPIDGCDCSRGERTATATETPKPMSP